MGPGDRLQVNLVRGIAFGIYYYNWPYQHQINISFLCFSINIGLGLPYTDPDYETR